MTDTYGHDEAMRDLELLSTNPAAQRNRVNRLAAYIARLEAADTRLLAAAEAFAEKFSGHCANDLSLVSTEQMMCDDNDGDCCVNCWRAFFRAAIEQRKEGRS